MTKSPIINRVRALRRDATPPERALWRFLRTLRAEGFHFRRQAPFRAYVLDFVCYTQRLVIEVDGAQHGDADRRARDVARDTALAREGFRTVRFYASDVLNNLEGVSMAIRAHLATPHPDPPHEGRGKCSASTGSAYQKHRNHAPSPFVGRVGVGEAQRPRTAVGAHLAAPHPGPPHEGEGEESVSSSPCRPGRFC